MKERPILFNTEMVKAILDGRKTQTRRVIKPQPPESHQWDVDARCWLVNAGKWITEDPPFPRNTCPHGVPGDRLWVRETHAVYGVMDSDNPRVIYRADSPPDAGISWRPSIHMPRWASRINLEITGVRVERVQDIEEDDAEAEGIFIDNNCIVGTSGAGGVHREIMGRRAFAADDEGHECPIDAFEQLWDSINAKRGYSWESNPWVWVVEFKQVQHERD